MEKQEESRLMLFVVILQIKTQGLIIALCLNLAQIPDEICGSIGLGDECWISILLKN